jgi:UDP-N-acetylmuramyl pentapeptide synthase
MIEVTGARGKTTTAHALAHLMRGAGVLHSSRGTVRYPEHDTLWKASITPASVLRAAREARKVGGWLVAEESLGVSGAGNLAVITSPEDYRMAAGSRSALSAKLASASRAATLVAAPGVDAVHPRLIRAGEVAVCEGDRCRFRYGALEGEFHNPLLLLPGYRTPLQLAAAAACAIGIDPAPLAQFEALPGRMRASRTKGVMVVDNANSGTNAATTIEAARYARHLAGEEALTLVIGTESRTICEGFPDSAIDEAVGVVLPDRVIRVGEREGECRSLDEAWARAKQMTTRGSIVLSVKTWR